ncbi:uncharacterized protein V6R79_001446 [Siganus canaliculatus]
MLGECAELPPACLSRPSQCDKAPLCQCAAGFCAFTCSGDSMDTLGRYQGRRVCLGVDGDSFGRSGPCRHTTTATDHDVQSWKLCLGDAVWLRNQVVAPATEELVFRGAMLPMMVPCAGPTASIFLAPLFFGVAHFHHIIEQRRLHKDSMSVILLVSGMQFLYTTVFGAFTAFIFMRTGHVVGPILCHSFCNSQGLPDISSALQHPQCPVLLFSYVMGLLLFLVLLFPLTDPFFYGAIPVCSLAPPPETVCQIK